MIRRSREYREIKRRAPNWSLCVSDECYYLLDDKDGAIWFHPLDDEMIVHVELKVRGKEAKRTLEEAFQWMFENTDCRKIVATVEPHRRDVSVMARALGMGLADVEDTGIRCYELTKEAA